MRPFLLFAVTAAALAQAPETFEVASIKLGDPLSPGTSFRFEPGASLKVENASLEALVLYAYQLRDFQLSGATGWMKSERYTIQAKGTIAEGPADWRQMNDRQRAENGALIRKRLQALLAERFQVAVHRETKEMPVYALVVAKGGHKLTPNASPDGSPQSSMSSRSMIKAQRGTVEALANGLANIVGRPVRDETGLKGYFDFKVEWTPDRAPAAPDAAERPPENAGPTLFTALQEQLGLKLESRKGPVEIVVIDRAERPSEN